MLMAVRTSPSRNFVIGLLELQTILDYLVSDLYFGLFCYFFVLFLVAWFH